MQEFLREKEDMTDTLGRKILARHLREGSLEKGRTIGIEIDQCLTQDSTGTMAWLEFEALGLDRVKAETVVSYCDHTSLSFKGESTDDHLFLQTIASRYGAVFSKAGNGVCHQLHYERFGAPGKTLLGSDSHTPTSGALGMVAIGAGGMDVAVAMGGGLFYLAAPGYIKVNLTGRLPWGVSAKDVILEILRRISVKGGVGHIIEYGGQGVKTLSIPERATITNMGAETGATTSVFPSDEVTKAFLEAQGRGDAWEPLDADEDAEYDRIIDVDLSEVKPLVALTGMPDNVHDLDEEEVRNIKLNQVFIGSCTNGGYRDIRRAALMLEGKTVSPEVEFIVSPGSRQVQQMLIEDGSYAILTRAGARLIDPGCNACIGIGFVPGHEHYALRTVNRNWKGRGGSKHANLILSGVEVAAASALTGRISDPRVLEPVGEPEENYIVDDLLMIRPEGADVEVVRSPNIVAIKPQEPLPDRLEGEALIKVGDGISTDDILPAGPLTQHLRSNLPEISKFTFHYIDDTFAERALKAGGGFIVGGDNYGQGSSREHAALGPYQLDVKAVFAKSFARIHLANLINAGIVPFTCDTDKISSGDRLSVDVSELKNEGMRLKNETTGEEIPLESGLSGRDIKILKAGGLLGYTSGLGK